MNEGMVASYLSVPEENLTDQPSYTLHKNEFFKKPIRINLANSNE